MKEPRIIVALDYPDAGEALGFAARVSHRQCRLKVGLELYTAAGPALVGNLVDSGFDVFLDLKFHDIPNTVARACAAAARLGVWMINVHTLGGVSMMRSAREAVDNAPHRPLLIGVTILTSHGLAEMSEIGLSQNPAEETHRLARLAKSAALDGVVCSPNEARSLRTVLGPEYVLVTPGVRPETADRGDQHRILTPAGAIREGADFLVVGRPITRSEDPAGALEEIRRDIGEA